MEPTERKPSTPAAIDRQEDTVTRALKHAQVYGTPGDKLPGVIETYARPTIKFESGARIETHSALESIRGKTRDFLTGIGIQPRKATDA